MSRLRIILASALAILLVVAAGWGYQAMAASKDRAVLCRQGLADCRQMAAQIESHAKRPAIASEGEMKSTEITALVEQAAKASGIPLGSLTQIFPDEPQRLGDLAYKEKPTQVRVENVSLTQLVTILHTLAANPKPLQAKAIRIVAPRQETVGVWTAELTLTYLIYDPAPAGAAAPAAAPAKSQKQ